MVSERRAGLFEPGENAAVALVERALRCSDGQARNDLVDELPLAARLEARDDFFVIEDPRGDQRLLPARLVQPKRVEVGQVR
jgi:hypothetical protein